MVIDRRPAAALLGLFTLEHLAVDGICGAALAAYAVNEPYLEPILFYFGGYNLIAFGGQWLAGLFLDKRPRLTPYALAFSLALLMLGTISAVGIMRQMVFLGLGNCLFHVAAGSFVLRHYQTYSAPGIFVSSGAIGLALGLNRILAGELFLAVYALLLALMYRLWPSYPPSSEVPDMAAADGSGFPLLGASALLLACVVMRGFGGSGQAADYVMLLPCVFALGKALGGLCCDRFGYRHTVVAIFLLGFLALQGEGLMPMLLLALAFNMTMPLTLRLVHWCRPSYPGLMFGLAAGSLLPGAFFAASFHIVPPAMITVQFLALVLAGYLCRKSGRRVAAKW